MASMASTPTAGLDEDLEKIHVVPDPFPVVRLECGEAFAGLSPEERRYTHHVGRASWLGSLLVLDQVSPESPTIFECFQALFKDESFDDLAARAIQTETASEAEVRHFGQYVAQFYGNLGNYSSFGDSKFIPRVSRDKFTAIVALSASAEAKERWAAASSAVYSVEPSELMLGHFYNGGTTTYIQKGISADEVENARRFMSTQGISPYNTLLRRGVGTGAATAPLQILQASADAAPEAKRFDHEGTRFEVRNGVWSRHMRALVDNLTLAREAAVAAGNEAQADMHAEYVEHFRSGDIEHHKEAQRIWVKRDPAPTVECNLGFVESYRDPSGIRGEFQGFVAVVNKETSRKFAGLIAQAEALLKTLPWPATFESDSFTKPSFTSLEVVAFAGSGVPAGINIPNYDDIRKNPNYSFKNVSLQNVLSARPKEPEPLLGPADQELYIELRGPSFEVQVGGHELLGHGSGKLLFEGAFDPATTINPLTGEPVTSWYQPKDTYDGRFGELSSSMEECRAECVGLLMSTRPEVLSLFGHTSAKEQGDVTYINWLMMAVAGLRALMYYSPGEVSPEVVAAGGQAAGTLPVGKWRQAHMQARFGILQSFLAAGEGFCTVDYEKCTVALDRSKIHSVGIPAVEKALLRIHVYKATGDANAATSFYTDDLTHPTPELLALRGAVIQRRRPRPTLVQANTVLKPDGTVELKQYEGSVSGMIDSFRDRFRGVDTHVDRAPSAV